MGKVTIAWGQSLEKIIKGEKDLVDGLRRSSEECGLASWRMAPLELTKKNISRRSFTSKKEK